MANPNVMYMSSQDADKDEMGALDDFSSTSMNHRHRLKKGHNRISEAILTQEPCTGFLCDIDIGCAGFHYTELPSCGLRWEVLVKYIKVTITLTTVKSSATLWIRHLCYLTANLLNSEIHTLFHLFTLK